MKKTLIVLTCLVFMFCTFFAFPVSASTSAIDTEEVSGNTGTSISNQTMYCDGDAVGTCTLTSSRKSSLFVSNRYVTGYATCKATSRTRGKYNYYENYARVAYAETSADINVNITTQNYSTCTIYGNSALATYKKEGMATGVIYCYTRVSYKNSAGNQTHGGVGRYYIY